MYHGIEMSPDEGLILIAAELQNGLIVIKISDNGIGMSRETLNTILSGGKHSSGKSSGSGVGVRNVNERIGLYYGREFGLAFESELEEGTTVTIVFPAVRTKEGQENAGEGETL
ncbi:sensory histidine kinase AtoS [compost metagenome]